MNSSNEFMFHCLLPSRRGEGVFLTGHNFVEGL